MKRGEKRGIVSASLRGEGKKKGEPYRPGKC